MGEDMKKHNLQDINHFSENEFPEGVLEHVSPELIKKLDEFREKLGVAVTPSPVETGWIRTHGSETSRHYVGRNADLRLSDAGDVFPNCDLFYAMVVAIQVGFKGIGLYYDTFYGGKKRPMLHLDLRESEKPVIWVRKGNYTTIFPRPDLNAFEFMEGIA